MSERPFQEGGGMFESFYPNIDRVHCNLEIFLAPAPVLLRSGDRHRPARSIAGRWGGERERLGGREKTRGRARPFR